MILHSGLEYQKFIILSMPRSGSNYLAYLLNSHPHITCFGEIFDKRTVQGKPANEWIQRYRYIRAFRNRLPLFFLKTLIFHPYPEEICAVGFRYFYRQAQDRSSVLKYLLSLKSLKVIHLVRRNMLANLTSFRIAMKTKVWNSLDKETQMSSVKPLQVTLSFEECLKHFEESSRFHSRFQELFRNFSNKVIYYEDLASNRKVEVSKVTDLLELEQKPLSCNLKKQNTRPLEELIDNYGDLKRQFAGSQWSSFFTETVPEQKMQATTHLREFQKTHQQ
jgi:LPS sulfotransferase NodH